MKKLFILLVSVLSVISCSQKADITIIDDLKVFEEAIQQKDIQLIDVRTIEEFEKGSIGNAKQIDVLQEADFLAKVGELDKSKPVYLFCRSGNRSNTAAILLKGNGFKQVFDFSPGYKGWSAAKSKK